MQRSRNKDRVTETVHDVTTRARMGFCRCCDHKDSLYTTKEEDHTSNDVFLHPTRVHSFGTLRKGHQELIQDAEPSWCCRSHPHNRFRRPTGSGGRATKRPRPIAIGLCVYKADSVLAPRRDASQKANSCSNSAGSPKPRGSRFSRR